MMPILQVGKLREAEQLTQGYPASYMSELGLKTRFS